MNTTSVLKKNIIEPALLLLPERMRTDQAKVMLLAIGLQESRFVHRRQIGGPARGFWQFEDGRLSGLAGLITYNVVLSGQKKAIQGELTLCQGVREQVQKSLEKQKELCAISGGSNSEDRVMLVRGQPMNTYWRVEIRSGGVALTGGKLFLNRGPIV